MDIEDVVEVRRHRPVCFDEVVDEKSEDDGGVCDAVMSRKCRSSGFGWVEYVSVREVDELTSDGVGDVIPPDHAANCVE